MLTSAVVSMHIPLHDVLHSLPLAQLFALSACHAWSSGLEPANGTYHDDQFNRELEAVKRRRSTQNRSQPETE